MNKMPIVRQKKGHNALYLHLCRYTSPFIISEWETDDKCYFQDIFNPFYLSG
jgi:hypothetical protein